MSTILKVESRQDLKRYIEYPYQKYKNHPVWVPPLLLQEWEDRNPKKNPFFDHSTIDFFLATDGTRIVGRIAAIEDKNYNDFHKEQACLFADLEAENANVAKELLTHVENWARTKNLNVVRGPSKVTQNDMTGFLIENFDDPPVVMMNWNPREYAGFAESAGYVKSQDTFAWKLTVADGLPERVSRVADRVQKNLRVKLRTIDMKNLAVEVQYIREIYNAAWNSNWGFVPWTEDELNHMKDQLKQVADKDVSFIAEIDGRPVGFSLVLPDIHEALRGTGGKLLPFGIFKLLMLKPKRMRLIALGILPEYQGRGLDALLYAEGFRRGQKKYSAGEFGWTLESNEAINSAMRTMGATPYKRYRIFEKKL